MKKRYQRRNSPLYDASGLAVAPHRQAIGIRQAGAAAAAEEVSDGRPVCGPSDLAGPRMRSGKPCHRRFAPRPHEGAAAHLAPFRSGGAAGATASDDAAKDRITSHEVADCSLALASARPGQAMALLELGSGPFDHRTAAAMSDYVFRTSARPATAGDQRQPGNVP